MRSVDGHALPIDELKGTKPVESIDLSGKGDKIGFASCIIIAACIKENAVLKELKCAARPLHATALTACNTHFDCVTALRCSLQNNHLGNDACRAIEAAAGSRVELAL